MRLKKTVTLLIALSICFLSAAQQPEESDLELEKAAVTDLLVQFLMAVGDYNVATIQTMFSEKANMSGASFRDGK